MEEDIQNYSPSSTVMFRGTPCTLISFHTSLRYTLKKKTFMFVNNIIRYELYLHKEAQKDR